MDKNKIATIIVAIIWGLTVFLDVFRVINPAQFRIISLIIVVLYAMFFYRDRIFKKK